MKVETSGEILSTICEVQTDVCVARTPAPVTAVWTTPDRRHVQVCGACLEEMVRNGEWEVPGARIPPRHDVTVLDRHGRPRLLIDVKGSPCGADVHDWPRRVHRNLVGFPDRFFAWAPAAARDPESAPTYELRCEEVLAPLLSASERGGGDDPAARERVVAAWMESVLASAEPGTSGPAGWLAGSGVLATLRGGFVARQLAAA
jgi:hypothetical protein